MYEATPKPHLSRPVFIGNEIYRQANFGAKHPLSVPRVPATIDLVRALGWLPDDAYVESSQASLEDLLRFHDGDYIEVLRRGERDQALPEALRHRHNLGKMENPIHDTMYTRPATSAGAMLAAADLLAAANPRDGRAIVYSPTGGTHHGRPDRASGFCYLNDLALALLRLLDHGIGNIFYVDFDAHHGDGVQDAFGDDGRVFTLSIHEDGRWPFSGALGDCAGGHAANVPVPRHFNDQELDLIVDRLVVPIGRTLRPDVVVIQCGADALADDPLSRLELTNNALWRAVGRTAALADKVLVTGGGGYNPWSVARCWSGVWATLNGFDIPDRLPDSAETMLRQLTWSRAAGRNPPEHWFTTLADPADTRPVRDQVRQIIDTVCAQDGTIDPLDADVVVAQ
ncbi:MAG: acetoin utilization protein AcuC [Alphaproteobacteria bacterium]|nr:acetoin utilization protein AcuC [Alphaproteobacteria bacterium]